MANSLMLNSLEIRNFRRFRQLRIERLGRVNLIVGQNNIGKTCLLEALSVYAHRGKLATIWELLEARGESIHYSTAYSRFGSRPASNPIVQLNDLENIFYNRVSLKSNPEPIQIGPLKNADWPMNGSQTLCLQVEWFTEQVNEQGQLQMQRLLSKNMPQAHNSMPALSVYVGQKMAYTQRLEYSRLLSQPFLNGSNRTCIFIPAHGLSAKQISQLWDQISLTEQEESVLEALQLIAPELRGINLKERYGEPVPFAKLEAEQKPIALASMGEGLNRLFGITLALVNAKNGLLLIDEIEGGLYHMVLPEVWRFIFKLASQLNVQLFATCHSWDCVEAFTQAVGDHSHGQEEAYLISLREHRCEKGKVAAVVLDKRKMTIATEDRIEVR